MARAATETAVGNSMVIGEGVAAVPAMNRLSTTRYYGVASAGHGVRHGRPCS